MNHAEATYCHLIGWKDIIRETYGHQDYYLLAEEQSKIIGILPLFHLKSLLFGTTLISLPFLDYGGILADNQEIEKKLISQAMDLVRKLKVDSIEIRHKETPPWVEEFDGIQIKDKPGPSDQKIELEEKRTAPKVRLLLHLPETSDILMKSFKSKLRSQIMRSVKEGCRKKVGGPELLDEFYRIFSINMRDLGSPVHAKKLFENLFKEFPKETKICLVSKDNQCMAASIVIGFKGVLENPWASSLHRYSRLSPNMLLYWAMLEYGCDNGFKFFDFGRSSPGGGTFKFKEQWGANSQLLHWFRWPSTQNNFISKNNTSGSKGLLLSLWRKSPLFLTNWLGPKIRGSISL